MGDEPGGNEEGEGGGLRPLTEKEVAGSGTESPKEDAGGPVLVEIENLRGEEDGGAESGGADGVEGDGEGRKTRGEEGPSEMEHGDHEKDEAETGGGRESGPVGGDKERDAGGEEHGAKQKSDKDGPAERGAAFVSGFESEDAVGGSRVNDACGEPSLDAGGELG